MDFIVMKIASEIGKRPGAAPGLFAVVRVSGMFPGRMWTDEDGTEFWPTAESAARALQRAVAQLKGQPCH
jgi:hypothetical protein